MRNTNGPSQGQPIERPRITDAELARAMAMAALDGGTTAGDVAEALSIPPRRAGAVLRKVVKAGGVVLTGLTKGARYQRAAT